MRISDWSSDVCSSDLLAINLDQLFETMDAEDHRTAEGAARLEPVLDRGQSVQRTKLVEHEPCAQGPRARPGHEEVDGAVHPERQQRLVHRQIAQIGGHDADRSWLL